MVNFWFLLIALGITIITQVLKKIIGEKFSKYIPIGLLIITSAIYWLISGNVITGIVNGLVLTALSTYLYDLLKPLIEKIKSKIATRN